ncbi:topoisomerase I [Eremomyces bilateralis CBS 781.70]|uniref:DNA topoisomerase I n=1 Tax=Eremomyces bilateralis CBS 781.70 TaxID=1392243 RepID=A0A6G1GHP8_9PEZI|nr:topoisomerase I [Eremomyces bilateralis CBS 781.70]KAF1817598.1 topoisomerase I [Eremomyces bilateralis CBS 781.70]
MSSSSDDDAPLARKAPNGVTKTKDRILGAKTDRRPSTNGTAYPGVSIRHGPVDEDGDSPMKDPSHVNGAALGKRRSRGSLTNGKSYKDLSDSEEADNKPLTKRRKTSKVLVDSDDEDDIPLVRKAKLPPRVDARQFGNSSDDDVPLNKKLANEKAKIEKRAEQTAEAIKSDAKKLKKKATVEESESEDDVPLVRKKPVSKATTNGVKSSAAAKKAKSKAKPEPAVAPKKSAKKKAEEEMEEEEDEAAAEEEFKWWEQPVQGDGTKKWTTLEHNGVVFPPPYQPLPKSARLIYAGTPVTLPPEAEEIAGFYGAMLHSTVNVENPTFNKNFFEDFQAKLDDVGHGVDAKGNKIKIKRFEDCDFTKIHEYYVNEREKKKNRPAAEKKAEKAEKDEAEAQYMFCTWDGRKQKVGNFRVEPPGLFRGRGDHPKTGRVKKRVNPEQITINIGKEAKVPDPPKGHHWKEVKHDQEGTWLVMWQENINGAYKYVMLAANSDIKGQSDFKKFEKARELKKHIARIRKDYTKELKSEVMADRQRATAIYLIDKFALRAGNEKGEDEADTVGCCSLKFEHVTLKPPNTVVFDFLGKDSIRFYDEFEVDQQVFKNLKIFKKAPKSEGDEIFDRLTTSALNKHLSTYMQGLTAKVFRTYNASWTMASLLRDMKSTGTIAEKVKDYNDANRKVAILCNHKRTVAASHGTQIEKMQEKINGLRYQKWRIKMMMLDLEPKLKKKKGADYFKLDEDLTPEWLEQHQAALVEEQRQKITKKFEKDNEKLVADGQKPMKQKELDERLEVATDMAKKFKKENKTKKVEAEGKGASVDKFEANLDKLDQRIETMRVQLQDKDDNKEVALGTSKINYIDPRLTVVFSKKFNVPIERFFSKTLREKFDWAIKSVDEDWEF